MPRSGCIRQDQRPYSIIGPVSFTSSGDLAGATFHIFKIENGGKDVTVA